MGFTAIQLTMAALITNPLYTPFGWITRMFFEFFGNYGVAIIMFTILIRAVLIPLNISSQKSMIKTQTLSAKQAEIQRKYPDDKQKQQEEITKMMQENGAMSFSGCLLPFLQIAFIWPVYRIVSGPLQYLSQVSVENLQEMAKIAASKGLLAEAYAGSVDVNDIPLLTLLGNNSEFLRECVSKGFVKMSQILDLHFLGLDLTQTPEWRPDRIFADPGRCLPLLIIPALVLVTNIFSMRLTNILRPDYKEKKEAKERAKKNAAMSGQAPTDQTETTMKIMNWMMPILMLWTSMTMPSAMGLYWLIGGIMAIISQFIVYFLFTKPYQLKKIELEAKKQAFLKKGQLVTDGPKNNKKKKN